MAQMKKAIIMEYWLKKLSGELPKISLPMIYLVEKEKLGKQTIKHLSMEIPEPTAEKMLKTSKNSDIALFILALSGLNVLLYNYTGIEDLVVGTLYPEQFGNSGNILFCRNRIHEGALYKNTIIKTGEEVRESIKYGEYPFDDIYESLKLKKGKEVLDIFNVVFVYDKFQHNPQFLERFDIAVSLSHREKRLTLETRYNSCLFREETLYRFCRNLVDFFSEIDKKISQKISNIEIVSREEKERLLFEFNYTQVEYPRGKTIHGLFEEQVERMPDKVAVIGPSEGSKFLSTDAEEDPNRLHLQLTYGELNDNSRRLAFVLRKKGVVAGSIVGIIVERSVEMIVGLLGVLKAGGAYLPIAPSYPRERRSFMLDDSNAALLVCRESVEAKAKELEIQVVTLEKLQPLDSSTAPLSPVSAFSPAYIIYTSGTTGKPKGVLIEHRNVVRLLFNDDFLFDFGSADIWTMFHSYCFDFSVWEMYGALLYGGKLVVIPGITARDPRRYLEILKKQGVTVLNQTPSVFYNLSDEELKIPWRELCLKYIVFGGEALSTRKLKPWRKKYPGTKLINMFGITETTVHVTFKEIEEEQIELNISNIGKPIPTLGTYLMNKYPRLE